MFVDGCCCLSLFAHVCCFGLRQLLVFVAFVVCSFVLHGLLILVGLLLVLAILR